MTPPLTALISRLERASGRDGQLDADILRALLPGQAWLAPRSITASLDSALALVEAVRPGTMWRVGHDPDDGSFKAELVTSAPECRHARANHDTAPLAVLLALLRSLEAAA